MAADSQLEAWIAAVRECLPPTALRSDLLIYLNEQATRHQAPTYRLAPAEGGLWLIGRHGEARAVRPSKAAYPTLEAVRRAIQGEAVDAKHLTNACGENPGKAVHAKLERLRDWMRRAAGQHDLADALREGLSCTRDCVLTWDAWNVSGGIRIDTTLRNNGNETGTK